MFTFVSIFLIMVCKRYFPPEQWSVFQQQIESQIQLQTIGYSVLGVPLSAITLGFGPKRILMWSQMHGNETTTTKALVDFITWFLAPAQGDLQHKLTLCIVPQLNPDGAKAYTRFNANGIDLNRDAVALSQPESIALRGLFDSFAPAYCLNLHDQRSIYAAGVNGPAASVSFLAPSADENRSITPARKIAIQHIAALVKELKPQMPYGIGRFDDTFNENCVGDTFSRLGVPTILFEAGHVPEDYQREATREYIVEAYKIFCRNILKEPLSYSVEAYFDIPENTVEFVDVLVSGARIKSENQIIENQFLALQYEERLKDNTIHFVPTMHSFGSSPTQRAHRTIPLASALSEFVFEFKAEKSLNWQEFDVLFPEIQYYFE